MQVINHILVRISIRVRKKIMKKVVTILPNSVELVRFLVVFYEGHGGSKHPP